MVIPILMAALLGCFAGAAVLALAEVSIVRVRRSEAAARSTAGDHRAVTLLRLIDDLPVVLNSILFAVLVLQIGAATIGAFLAGQWVGGVGVSLASVALTMLLFIYAEAIPKTIAVRSPYDTALRVAPLLAALSKVLRPLVSALLWLAALQAPGSGTNLGAFSEEELLAAAREAAAAGEIEHVDAELVAKSFYFNDRMVGEVMVPLPMVAAVSGELPVKRALAVAINAGHRRLPVLNGQGTGFSGMVRLRDLAAESHLDPQTLVSSLTGPVLECTEATGVAPLLRLMQQTGTSMAIVSRSDGSPAGIVTIEDLAAELLGEITDDRTHTTFDSERQNNET